MLGKKTIGFLVVTASLFSISVHAQESQPISDAEKIARCETLLAATGTPGEAYIKSVLEGKTCAEYVTGQPASSE